MDRRTIRVRTRVVYERASMSRGTTTPTSISSVSVRVSELSVVPISPDLRPVIDGMIDIARDSVPGVEIHSFLDGSSPPSRAVSEGASPTPSRTRSESPDSAPALHVSLTHPLSLRGHVARTLVSDLGAAFRKARISPFTASLSTPKIYHNTSTPRRAFIALRVGAGVRELQEILEKIVRPHLRRYHVEAYYDRPEWHASFAWCLDGGELSDTSPFPASLVADLGQPKTHAWQVSEICVKVGKEVTRIPL